MNRIHTLIPLALALLLATGCDKPVKTGADTAGDSVGVEPAVTVKPLQVAYKAPELADLQTAEQVANNCKAEVTALSASIPELEQFAAVPGVDNYLEPVNAWLVSYGNLSNAMQLLAQVHPDAKVREAADTCRQTLSGLSSDMSLSRPVFDRISRVDITAANADTQRFVKKLLLEYSLSGVDKDKATRARIKKLNEQITAVGQEFDKNIRDSVLYLELDSADQLAGLPKDYIDAHPAAGDGKIRISTQYPDLFPFLTYAKRDDLRRKLTVLYSNRAYPENRAVLQHLLALRFELARQLGFSNYAELVTADKMAGSPQRVQGFLQELARDTTEPQDREYAMLLARLQKDQPDAKRVDSWQYRYLKEKIAAEQFHVDSKEVRQYFNYNGTRDGILRLVQDLFGVQIKPWETETWHKDVESYELWGNDQLIGRFYLDMHPREGKYQHAATFPIRNGISGEQLPLAALVCNFPRDNGLMQHVQVETFLHEFGHLIHHLFAGNHHWDNVSGINTEWDFVEAPSQMLEEWVWDYDTISQFAKNAKGVPIPRELLQRMTAARDFGLGIGTRGQLSYAAISLGLYNQNPAGLDLKAFADNITRQYSRFEPLAEGNFYASFGHLNGYSANYYTYQWSLAIATDMFTRFQKEGLRNVETAGAYRDTVLSEGGAKPAAQLVKDFLGRDISFKPYAERLRRAGLPAEVAK